MSEPNVTCSVDGCGRSAEEWAVTYAMFMAHGAVPLCHEHANAETLAVLSAETEEA